MLKRAASAGFDVLITNDRGLEYEQNLASLPLGVVVLIAKSNIIEDIRSLYPNLLDVLDGIRSCEFVKVTA